MKKDGHDENKSKKGGEDYLCSFVDYVVRVCERGVRGDVSVGVCESVRATAIQE